MIRSCTAEMIADVVEGFRASALLAGRDDTSASPMQAMAPTHAARTLCFGLAARGVLGDIADKDVYRAARSNEKAVRG